MNFDEYKSQLEFINSLKTEKSYDNYTLKDLQSLPILNGVIELSYKNNFFYMININNDDSIPLKYLWRNSYEPFSLEIWCQMSKEEGYCIDVGSHTGIYSIIPNLGRDLNNIISIEPYFLNFSRLVDNLSLNNIATINCIYAAVSNFKGESYFSIDGPNNYKTQGGYLSSNKKDLNVQTLKLDSLILDKKIIGIKIDTEGHENQVIEGADEIINKYKPDIIFEYNIISFEKCISYLSPYGYSFYFIDEKNRKFSEDYSVQDREFKSEGVNCLATINLNKFIN